MKGVCVCVCVCVYVDVVEKLFRHILLDRLQLIAIRRPSQSLSAVPVREGVVLISKQLLKNEQGT